LDKKEIIKKLKALSDRGVAGEKENATKLLQKLMKKYGISEEEIQKEELKVVNVTLKNKAERKICVQILYAYFNHAILYQQKNKRTTYYTKLTAAQEIEFKYMLSIYLDSFYKEQDILISAFIQKNDIFPDDEEAVEQDVQTKESRQRALKKSAMMTFMEKTQIRKALNG